MNRRPDQVDFLVAVGERLSLARRAAGLTQAQVAELAELDAQTVHRIESAKIAVSLLRLRDLARALGISLRDAVGEVDSDSDRAAEVSVLWSRISDERRELALRVLRDFARP